MNSYGGFFVWFRFLFKHRLERFYPLARYQRVPALRRMDAVPYPVGAVASLCGFIKQVLKRDEKYPAILFGNAAADLRISAYLFAASLSLPP